MEKGKQSKKERWEKEEGGREGEEGGGETKRENLFTSPVIVP